MLDKHELSTMVLAQRAHAKDSELERLRTALRRIGSLGEKNVPKYAQEIAREALSVTNGER